MESGMAKRLWHVLRALYYMLRRGLSKKQLMMDFQLLLGRGKLAGKAFHNLLRSHQNFTTTSTTSYNNNNKLSLYNPRREVEFSCSNTPSNNNNIIPPVFALLLKNTTRRGRRSDYGQLDAAALAKAFEMLSNAEITESENATAVMATPSPMLSWFGKSPAGVRQLRITDSPFPVVPECDERVDNEAEEFIKRFYEQLRIQQSATPEYRRQR